MSNVQADNATDPLDEFDFKDPYTLLGNIHPDKVIAFFGLISRVEYAVMLLGVVLTKGRRLQVDWEKFAESMSGQLDSLESKKLQLSIDYLTQAPPHEYLNTYQWEPRTYNPTLSADSRAILAAKDVRNNLFHGLKFNNPDQDRNNELIDAASNIFRGCLMACPELNEYYNS